MTNENIPFLVTPPGHILKDELDARGWSQKDFAEIIGRPEQAISEIVTGRKEITPQTAIEFSKAFGTSAEFWVNLESNYQIWKAQKTIKSKQIDRRARLYSLGPINELKKLGWIKNTNNLDTLESEVVSFLGLKSVDDKPVYSMVARHSKTRNPEQVAIFNWIKRVEKLISGQQTGSFNKTKFRKHLPELLKFAGNERDILNVPGFLINHGVHFALVPHLQRTYLDGAFFWNGKSPVIALTLRYGSFDSFWFTLMHEIGHLIFGHKGPWFDTIYNRTEDADTLELEADNFARDQLVDPDEYSKFIAASKSKFPRSEITGLAEKLQRHKSIVLGRLKFDGAVDWNTLRSWHVSVKDILSSMYDKPILL